MDPMQEMVKKKEMQPLQKGEKLPGQQSWGLGFRVQGSGFGV